MRCLFEKLIDNPQELDWFLSYVVTPEWHFQHDAGRPFADLVAERSAEFPKYAPLIRAYAERFVESIPGPVDGSFAIVEALAAKNVPLFELSNFGDEAWVMFRPTAPIFDLFQDVIISGREGLVKPDHTIYELALQRFDRKAEQCLFIDDRLENIEAGEALGISGHIFKDSGIYSKTAAFWNEN